MEKIKLVIWDLDDTFWNGTLSDGEIIPIDENIKIIKDLTDRGIVNSICSKNDFDKTKAKLEELGVWDYFVFPSIDWTPKGTRVKQIIEDMNLRPVNVLFLDDNINNLEEAKYVTRGLQTALPNELKVLLKDEAFKGKDDRTHSRLKQYKILEVKAEARKESGSNEEFLYQSEIKVELIEQCDDKLERIYEMIHRNNQLNFTKDRISQEEVNQLFTDENVKHGVVHVTDKYGDHGIIGCYAIKDGKALQFVFSCRILGMGIEQWVYAQLGYPEISIVGEVSGELNKIDNPSWINVDNVSKAVGNISEENQSRLIVYGSCPLRPVWAYLEPQLPFARFALIAPSPSVCNLAVIKKNSHEKLKEWLDNVKIFDKEYTFDFSVYDDSTDAILITLDHEWMGYKYISKSDQSYFYTRTKLDTTTATEKILNEYSCEKLTTDDIYSELDFLLSNLSKNTKLIILTVPEVEFPGQGKDLAYTKHVEMTRITFELQSAHENLQIVDIRKYAKTPMDFFEYVSNHYNRDIGYKVSNDILSFLGGQNIKKQTKDNLSDPPENTFRKEIVTDFFGKVIIETYIRNFQLITKVLCEKDNDVTYSFKIIKNRYEEFIKDFSKDNYIVINLHGPGRYKTEISINDSVNRNIKLHSPVVPFTEINYGTYLDPDFDNYNESTKGLNHFVNNNKSFADITQLNHQSLCELAAEGINISDYFLSEGINEIVLFTDEKTGKCLLPFIHRSELRIKCIYTMDSVDSIKIESDGTVYDVHCISDGIDNVDKGTHVLFATDKQQSNIYSKIFSKKTKNIYWLGFITHSIKTQLFFKEQLKQKHAPKFFFVRGGNMVRSLGMPYSYITSNEKLIEHNVKDDKTALEMLAAGKKMPPSYEGISRNEFNQTLRRPAYTRKSTDNGSNILVFKDQKNEYFNIINGFRKTCNNPKEYNGTIYIFGGIATLGIGVKDEDTIASKLQQKLKYPFRVLNYSNTFSGFSEVVDLIRKTRFDKNDIVIIFMSNWRIPEVQRTHWLKWEAAIEPVTKIDTFPLFAEQGRPDYFLLPYAYNAECNDRIAELINNKISDYLDNINEPDKKANLKIQELEARISDLERELRKLNMNI